MRLLVLIALFSFQALQAQEIGQYIPLSTVQKGKDFCIVAIENETSSESIQSSKSKRVLKYTSVTHDKVSNLIQNFAPPLEGTKPFLAIVKKFEIYDERKAAYDYEGKVAIEIDFYSIYEGDTSIFYNGVGGGTFNFQYRDKALKDIGGFCKQVVTTICKKFESEVKKNIQLLPSYNTGSVVNILPFRSNYIADTVFYQRGKISWELFRGKQTKASKYSAAIFPGFAFSSTLELKNGKIIANVEPYVYMVPNMSWVKNGTASDYSLAHEQLHFDIAYLSCLTMLEKIKEVQTTSVKDLQSHIQYEYLMAYQFMNKMQKAYDSETKHGLDTAEQERWRNKIKFELEKFL